MGSPATAYYLPASAEVAAILAEKPIYQDHAPVARKPIQLRARVLVNIPVEGDEPPISFYGVIVGRCLAIPVRYDVLQDGGGRHPGILAAYVVESPL